MHLCLAPLHDGNAFGLGLLAALLRMPLPWIGAAAWVLQIAGLLRRLAPAGLRPGSRQGAGQALPGSKT